MTLSILCQYTRIYVNFITADGTTSLAVVSQLLQLKVIISI